MSTFLDALNAPPEPPQSVHLFSSSLLSKWGFGDGDDLNWLYEFGVRDKHAVLCAVVRRRLLPALRQKVEVEEICTIHNPIRAKTVDGMDVRALHCEIGEKVRLEPEFVEVPGADIVAIAKEIGA